MCKKQYKLLKTHNIGPISILKTVCFLGIFGKISMLNEHTRYPKYLKLIIKRGVVVVTMVSAQGVGMTFQPPKWVKGSLEKNRNRVPSFQNILEKMAVSVFSVSLFFLTDMKLAYYT